MPNQSDHEKLSTGQKVATGVLGLAIVSLAVAAPVLIGIAIFDRSRSITDPVVIAAGVFFALSILYGVGSGLKQCCVQNITYDQGVNR